MFFLQSQVYHDSMLTSRLQNIKHDIEGKPVSWYSEVFNIVFPDLDRGAANKLWKKQLSKPSKKKAADLSDEEADDVNPST